MSLSDQLERLRSGECTFAEFASGTRNLWKYMAARLLRSRDPGIGVDAADVEQEMLVAAWLFVGRWEDGRGAPIDKYVLFNSCDKAKKWLDGQREATSDGRTTRAPKLGRAASAEMDRRLASSEAGDPVEAGEFLAKLSVDDRVVVKALLETGNASAAALHLYNHYPHRIRFRLGCEQAALRLVKKVVVRLCADPALWVEEEEDHHGG